MKYPFVSRGGRDNNQLNVCKYHILDYRFSWAIISTINKIRQSDDVTWREKGEELPVRIS